MSLRKPKLAQWLTTANLAFLAVCFLLFLSGVLGLRPRSGIYDTLVDPLSVFGPVILSPILAVAALITGDRKEPIIRLNYYVILPLSALIGLMVIWFMATFKF